MIVPPARARIARRAYDIDADLLALGVSDRRGVPIAGRAAEYAALQYAGARDPSAGRIFEGHLNGAQLVARCGTDERRAVLGREIDDGHIFGVWNTQDERSPLRIEASARGLRLAGGKTWASGAGSITRPVVTAAWPDGSIQLCVLRIDESAARIDASAWQPLGMRASDSFRVDLDGVAVEPGDLIGRPGDYAVQPWFHGGALRFTAVQTGVVERLYAETVAYLQQRARSSDAAQRLRVAEMRVALQTAIGWIATGVDAWRAFDADPSDRNAARLLDVVDMARVVVERAALDVIERAMRSVGAHGLVEPLPFAGLVRDLQMYLRQPAPDAVLGRIADRAFAAD